MTNTAKPAILIAGPTASGKTALALDLVARLGEQGRRCAIVNCDSMQIYQGIEVLAATPSGDERAGVPHHLFSALAVDDPCSAGRYLKLAGDVLAELWGQGATPVIVGGTGLYFRSLLEGIAPVPEIPQAILEEGTKIMNEAGAPALHASLAMLDAEMAAQLNANDSQRVLRAWSVHRATGQSLAEFQKQTRGAVLDEAQTIKFALQPDRAWLYQRCNHRFDLMLGQGGVAEVERLIAAGHDRNLPAMKALGIPSLIDWLEGRLDKDTAIASAKTQTRNYAKRQLTWVRNQMIAWNRLSAQQMESACDIMFAKINESPLT